MHFYAGLNSYLYTMYTVHFIKQESWTTLVEEDEKDVLEWAACVKQNLLVLCYLHDVKVGHLSLVHVHVYTYMYSF